MGDSENNGCGCKIVGKARDGTSISNSASISLNVNPWMTSGTHRPQLSQIAQETPELVQYKHTKLPPGEYLVAVVWEDVIAATKVISLEPETGMTIDFQIDPTNFGKLTIERPEAPNSPRTGPSVIPADLKTPFSFDPGYFWIPPRINISFDPDNPGSTQDQPVENEMTLPAVAPGKYIVRWGKLTGEVEVRANETAKILLE